MAVNCRASRLTVKMWVRATPVVPSVRGISLFGVMAINVVTDFRVSIFEQFLSAQSNGSWFDRALHAIYWVIVYVLQAAFSALWLQRYRYGPLEWLWRSFMYAAPQPFRVHEGGLKDGWRNGSNRRSQNEQTRF
jgi:uncharacterized membrane protein YeiB